MTGLFCVNNGVAYFTNSYGGLYVYDVSNQAAPKRIGKYTVPLYKGESNLYADMSESKSYVFPYDCSKYINSPVTGVALGDGKIFFRVHILHSIQSIFQKRDHWRKIGILQLDTKWLMS